MKPMKFKCRSLLGHVLFMTAFQAAVSQAAEISKAATGTVLGDAASWTGGVAPGAGDVAVWNSTSLRSGLSFGADLSW